MEGRKERAKSLRNLIYSIFCHIMRKAKALKKLPLVKGQWTLHEDRFKQISAFHIVFWFFFFNYYFFKYFIFLLVQYYFRSFCLFWGSFCCPLSFGVCLLMFNMIKVSTFSVFLNKWLETRGIRKWKKIAKKASDRVEKQCSEDDTTICGLIL